MFFVTLNGPATTAQRWRRVPNPSALRLVVALLAFGVSRCDVLFTSASHLCFARLLAIR